MPTLIEWTDETWNPITGCSVVSPGCTNCYAMRLAGTRLRNHPSRVGLTDASKAGPVWNGAVRLNESWLDQPLRWRRPRRVFVCAHGDLFHEAVPDAWIDQVFAVMALAPQHTFQVLTKRAKRMRAFLSGRQEHLGHAIFRQYENMGGRGDCRHAEPLRRGEITALPNVWLGVSVEDQARADERIPHLLATPAAVRFASHEPALGPVDWRALFHHCPVHDFAGGFCVQDCGNWRWLDWIITGGESGPGARPMHPDWARQDRDQCRDAGVAWFFKQWGAWAPDLQDSPHPINDDPEQSRFPTCVWNPERQQWDETNGCWDDPEQWTIATTSTEPEQPMTRIGKKAAGHLLDGREHREFPA